MDDEFVWNLSEYGQYNILKSLHEKMSRANANIECSNRSRTIINIDSYEATIICWALQEYSEKIESKLKEKNPMHDAREEADIWLGKKSE